MYKPKRKIFESYCWSGSVFATHFSRDYLLLHFFPFFLQSLVLNVRCPCEKNKTGTSLATLVNGKLCSVLCTLNLKFMGVVLQLCRSSCIMLAVLQCSCNISHSSEHYYFSLACFSLTVNKKSSCPLFYCYVHSTKHNKDHNCAGVLLAWNKMLVGIGLAKTHHSNASQLILCACVS